MQGSSTHIVELHKTLDAIPRAAWDSLFPGAPEDWGFYRAVEDAPPDGFQLGAITARDPAGTLVGAAPTFRLDYRLDTPFQGRFKGWLDKLHARRPGITSLTVLGIGSPLSDGCSLGFAPSLDATGRLAVFQSLVAALRREADRQRAAIVAIKGLGEEATIYEPVLKAEGFCQIKSVPIVMLPVAFPSLEQYLASLKRRYRSYFKSKMKTLPQIRVEFTRSAHNLEQELIRLYEATLSQSGVSYGDFDRIGPGYFTSFLERQGEKAQLMLFWRGDVLVGFHLIHAGDKRIISNKMGMRYPDARELNLYFINWLKIIEFATSRGVSEIEMGATTYAAKLLFGGHLEGRFVHFRFRQSLVNRITRPLHRFFDFERNDPELKKLRAEAKGAAASAPVEAS